MRRSIFGYSLGIVAAMAPALPAAGQTWLPSWSKLSRQKQEAAVPLPSTGTSPYGSAPGGGSAYGPATYSPSPYGGASSGVPSFGTAPYAASQDASSAAAPYNPTPIGATPGSPTPGGPALGGPALGGPALGGPALGGSALGGPAFGGAATGGPAFTVAGRPTAMRGATLGDTAPPQVDLGTPSNYGAAPGPAVSAGGTPPLTSPPAGVSTYGAPAGSSGTYTAAAPRLASPPPISVDPTPPAPMAAPGIGGATYGAAPYGAGTNGAATYGAAPYGAGTNGAATYGPATYGSPMNGPATHGSSMMGPTSPGAGRSMGSLPGYGGARSAVNYGSMNTPVPEGPSTYAASSPYGPSYGAPTGCSPYPPYCGSPGDISSCGAPLRWYEDLTAFYNYSAFKGPIDLDGLNGNFGSRVGVFGAVPLYAPLGIAAQAGSSYGWYDWKGTLYTGDGDRTQNFNTAGLFQRTAFGLNWGATYDWLFDDYYSEFHFEQVRTAVSFNINPMNEIGVWAAIPTRKDSATVGTPPTNITFEPVLQGNVFWRKAWNACASTNTFVGWCEEPNDVSFGSSAQFALNDFVAVNGGFQYLWPGSGGTTGREEEIWTISFGLVFYPGSGRSAATSQFRPLLAMPDNGNFAIRRH